MKKRVLSLFLAITLCLTLTPTGALAAEGQPPEQTVTATQEAQTGAGENAPPANPEENPTEDASAAAEKNTVDKETGKEAGQNEPTAEGKTNPSPLPLTMRSRTPQTARTAKRAAHLFPKETRGRRFGASASPIPLPAAMTARRTAARFQST